jgi:hypothetical protein
MGGYSEEVQMVKATLLVSSTLSRLAAGPEDELPVKSGGGIGSVDRGYRGGGRIVRWEDG